MTIGHLFKLKLLKFHDSNTLRKSKIEVKNLLEPEAEPLIVRHYHEIFWEDDKAMEQYTDIEKMKSKIKKFRT